MAEHKGFTQLKADLKVQQLQNAYIFYGEETYLRSRYLQQVRQLLIPAGFEEFNDHHLSGKGLTVQTLTEVVEAMPMMAQHTLVTVEDMDLFKLDEGQRNALIALLEDLPEYCTLIFIYDTLEYKRDGKMKSCAPRWTNTSARWNSPSRSAPSWSTGCAAALRPWATTSTPPPPTTCCSPAAR